MTSVDFRKSECSVGGGGKPGGKGYSHLSADVSPPASGPLS